MSPTRLDKIWWEHEFSSKSYINLIVRPAVFSMGISSMLYYELEVTAIDIAGPRYVSVFITHEWICNFTYSGSQ